MKKISISLLALLFSVCGRASTPVSTTNVYGHWTLSGSPYEIFNDIKIPLDSTLTIDPGVQVVFHGMYFMRVYGHLVAAGTSAAPITFRAHDTTGWYNDASPMGGWRGIFFDPYTSTTPDHSQLEYLRISDMKYGSYPSVFPGSVIETYRPVHFKHSIFFHNQMVTTSGQCIFQGNMQAGKFQLEDCQVYNNTAALAIISVNNYPAGNTVLNANKMHHNKAIDVIFSQQGPVEISKSEIYENENTGQGGSIIFLVTNSVGKIYENKIHHNTNTHVGPIFCNQSDVDITGNLITNNSNSQGWCHFTDGGAGIMLEVGKFTVRNNVIANNYTSYTGGGLKVYKGDAYIVNNTFVNNSSADHGPALHIANDAEDIHIKNNIFHNNVNLTDPTAASIYVVASTNIQFDYNYINRALATEMFKASGTFIGATTHNIVGTTPGLTAPTTATGASIDATVADFSLLATSACVDAGDSAGARCYATDYALATRVSGPKVDIGAYEKQKVNPINYVADQTAGTAITVFPNPASGSMLVQVPEAAGTLQITDIASRVVYTQSVTETAMGILLNNYIPGVYFVNWHNGNQTAIQKVLVR